MHTPEMILSNEFLEARFDGSTGALVHLSEPGGESLIDGCYCRYHDGTAFVSEYPNEEERSAFSTVRVERRDTGVESVIRSSAVTVTRRYELPEDSSLLKAFYTIEGTG